MHGHVQLSILRASNHIKLSLGGDLQELLSCDDQDDIDNRAKDSDNDADDSQAFHLHLVLRQWERLPDEALAADERQRQVDVEELEEGASDEVEFRVET